MFLLTSPRGRTRGRGRGRVRLPQIVGTVLIFFLMLSVLRMARRSSRTPPSQRSIYDYTEGKTTGGSRPGGNAGAVEATTAPSRTDEMAAYLRHLVNRHGLTQDIMFHARRIQPHFQARQKRESMTVVRDKFAPRHGFAAVRVGAVDEDDGKNRHHKQKQQKGVSQQKQQEQHLPSVAIEMATDSGAVLKLPLPAVPELPDQVDASALLLGISTTYARLVASNASMLHDWARWLTDGWGRSNGASLLLVLHRASASELGQVGAKLRGVGVDAVVRSSAGTDEVVGGGGGSPDSDNNTWGYLELMGQLAQRAQEISKEGGGTQGGGGGKKNKKAEKKYLGLIDDDIFFPSMHRLLARLGELDPTQPSYVGLPSEKADWTTMEDSNVTMTYGGGAVFVTRPMAEAIAKMPCAQEQQQQQASGGSGSGGSGAPPPPQSAAEETAATTGQWDERLYRCITSHHSTSLRVMPSFYTPEEDDDHFNSDSDDSLLGSTAITGGGAGGGAGDSYESGLRPLTLHHYRQRHQRFAPSRAHLIASLAGEGSFLQRFWFRGDGWVLVNGHSIAEYPDGVDVVPLPPLSGQSQKPSWFSSAMLVMLQQQQPRELEYDHDDKAKINNNKNHNKGGRDGGGASDHVRLASRIMIDSHADQKQERKDQKVVSWTGVKRVWRHLDSKIVRDEAGAVKEVWQAYVKRTGAALEHGDDRLDPSHTVHRQDSVSDLNSVIVLIWETPS